MTGGNRKWDDPEVVGILEWPLGQGPGPSASSRMTVTLVPAGLACPPWTSQTWIAITLFDAGVRETARSAAVMSGWLGRDAGA
jgi:hypothetical protein